ncbi:coronin-7-like [Babylonia areolata]|uniref:coronin-7-like n=1 Tax=Babylonia areolata TaxID=304850 RepID=UPI003FD15F49
MAWRFKVSKFKNAAPKFPKKEDLIHDIPVGNASHSCGNHVKASCVYMAFNTDSSVGGTLGYLPLSAKGRCHDKLSLIHAHGDFVTDLDFSPFDDYMLATGSQDNTIKVWVLPEESSGGTVSNPEVTLPSQGRRIENVLWHPAAEGVLAASTGTCVKLFDVASCAEKSAFGEHGDQVQSISWKSGAPLMVTTCRDKKMRVLDLRAGKLAQEVAGHQNVKDTRVQWLGDTEYIVSTGFSMSQEREVKLWDNRNLTTHLVCQPVQGSTGALMCFFDPDTNMIFLAGKGDSSVRFVELTEKSPYLTEGMIDRTEQVKGAAIVPKRAMDLMSGEVNRVLLLARSSLISLPFIVPRKSYREFHSDLFPDTASGEPALTAQQWFSGQDALTPKISLAPNKNLIKHEQRGTLFGSGGQSLGGGGDSQTTEEVPFPDTKPVEQPPSSTPKPAIVKEKPDIIKAEPTPTPSEPKTDTTPVSQQENSSPVETFSSQTPAKPAKPAKVFKGVRQSKYRYITGKTLHPSQHLTNLKNLSKTIPHDSDLFAANMERCAVPLEGAGGIIAVLELSKPGRLGDTADELPTIQNGSKVADLVWDPFDCTRLVVACDNAKINVWRVPPEGFPVGPSQMEPEFRLMGHMEKIYFVRFHPVAKDIIMSASYDMTVRMWNLDTRSEVMQLQGHQDQVFSLAWSPCGKQCATVCKDGKLRIFEPRKSTEPIKEGEGAIGTRGARVVWVLDGQYLVVSGFQSTSEGQQLSVHSVDTMETVCVEELGRSPSILIPFYDHDACTLYLFSRGERTVHSYDVSTEPPHLFDNASISLQSLQQGLSFLPRRALDVTHAEVARAWRLTSTSVEPVSFTVPRVRTEFFQDDLYPDTRVTWEPALTAEQWLSGQDATPKYVSLRPAGMKLLSEAPAEAPKPQKYQSFSVDTYKSDEQKKDELMTAMVGKLELSSDPLPQDLAEGVEDDEWDD